MGPARAFSLARTCPPKPWRRREARRQFRSKKVRIWSYNCTKIKLSDFCPTDSAARSAANLVGQIPESQILVGGVGFEPTKSIGREFYRLVHLTTLPPTLFNKLNCLKYYLAFGVGACPRSPEDASFTDSCI